MRNLPNSLTVILSLACFTTP